jgi:dTDP-4-dehydrorhamnose reductase
VLGHDGWARAGLPPMRHWREAFHAAWPHLRPTYDGPAGGRRTGAAS